MTHILKPRSIEFYGSSETWSPDASLEDVATSSRGIVADEEGFLFPLLSVDGKQYDILLHSDPLPGEQRTQEEHKTAANAMGLVVPNGKVWYAMLHRAYGLREEPSAQEVTSAFRDFMHEVFDFKSIHVGNRFEWGDGLEATIFQTELDGTTSSMHMPVPVFRIGDGDMNGWSSLSLAPCRPDTDFDNDLPFPPNAHKFLGACLGEKCEDAGKVFQYFVPQKTPGQLREIGVWTPALSNRKTPRELIFSTDFNTPNFDIDAGSMPGGKYFAYGVSVRATYVKNRRIAQ